MKTPFTRVSKISDEERRLVARGDVLGITGRTPAGTIVDHVAGRPGLDRRPDGDRDDDNFNPDGSRKDGHDRKPRYKVELLCRTFSGDVGLRPLPNMVFWESPDIEIVGPSGDPDVATPGQVNTVRVHVWNLGLADCWAAHVDLYWCNPSVGINPAVANPIGSKSVPLASGQHKTVDFAWVPELVNGGHECLVAQVYDPVSDPIVAPFNPVQDRHVGQRNISVVALAANETLRLDLFTQNLATTLASTRLEVQKLEGEVLGLLASAMGRRPWAIAGGGDLQISRPVAIDVPDHPHARALRTGTFRETLQGPPGTAEARRVTAVMRTLAASHGERQLALSSDPPPDQRPDQRLDTPAAGSAAPPPAPKGATPYGEQEKHEKYEKYEKYVADDVWADAYDAEAGGMPLDLLPGQHVRFSLETRLPRTVERGAADVWRVVEHTAGRITGGVTIIVQAK